VREKFVEREAVCAVFGRASRGENGMGWGGSQDSKGRNAFRGNSFKGRGNRGNGIKFLCHIAGKEGNDFIERRKFRIVKEGINFRWKEVLVRARDKENRREDRNFHIARVCWRRICTREIVKELSEFKKERCEVCRARGLTEGKEVTSASVWGDNWFDKRLVNNQGPKASEVSGRKDQRPFNAILDKGHHRDGNGKDDKLKEVVYDASVLDEVCVMSTEVSSEGSMASCGEPKLGRLKGVVTSGVGARKNEWRFVGVLLDVFVAVAAFDYVRRRWTRVRGDALPGEE
jgi:hypothetical protein